MKGQFPWIGRSRGSAGGMTTAKINDKNVMRAKAFEVTNPKTPAQQNQRNYFAELTKLSGSFTSEQLKTLFPMKPKAMSRRNALSKQLADCYNLDNGQKVIYLNNLQTLGNASSMDFGTTTVTASGSAVSVALDNLVKANTQIANNYFIAALVNVTKGAISLDTTSAKVSVGTIAPALPKNWETTDTIQAIPLITNQTEAVAAFGSFIIKTRPEQKGRKQGPNIPIS